jgi:hypothetical protein
VARKLQLLVLAFALVVSPLFSAEAVVKVGASCKKSGQVVVVKSSQFKCVKKGKKLIWSKSNERTQSAPSPTPSASPTPTLSASPTPTPSASTSAAPSPTQTTSNPSNPSPSPTKEVSQNSIVVQELLDAVWVRSEKSSSRYTVTIEPARKDSLWAKQSMELVDGTLDLVTKLGYPITTEFKIYFGWDWKWMQQYLPRNSWCYEGSWAGGGYCGQGVNFINLKFLADWQRSGDVEIPWRSEIDKLVGITTLSHELIHQAQADYLSKFNRNSSFYPAWIREGGPEVLKVFTYAKTNGITYTQARDMYIQRQYDRCQFVKLNELLMSDNHPDNCQSILGFIAVEALLATTKDVNSVFNFGASKISGSGPNFDQERRGISNETYRTVMKEMFRIEIDAWHPIVEKEFVKWAPARQS